MKTNRKKSFLADIPAWGLSLLTWVISFFLLFILAAVSTSLKMFSENFNELMAYILYFVFIIFACFAICKKYPRSVWYTPIICNITCLIAAFAEPNFWVSPLGIVLGGGFVLSITGAVIGARKGQQLIL
jgi:hypothetical protein